MYYDNPKLIYSDKNMSFLRQMETTETKYNDYAVYDSSYYENVCRLSYGNMNSDSDLMYLPDVYDYYLMFTVFSNVSVSEFSFCPTYGMLTFQTCEGDYDVMLDTSYYHHDKKTVPLTGFTVTAKISELFNVVPNFIHLYDESLGSVPEGDVYVKCQILQVQKGVNVDFSPIADILENIDDSINTQGFNISNAINEAMNKLQQTIEDQYSVSDSENFGVEDIVNQVNEKAGVLSFGTDTLVNFLDLFDAANATNTKLTFPGFSMKVQGVDYQVWPDYHYDLSELENQFGALIEVVRWSCVMVVWLAVLNYLVKAYDTIFGR